MENDGSLSDRGIDKHGYKDDRQKDLILISKMLDGCSDTDGEF